MYYIMTKSNQCTKIALVTTFLGGAGLCGYGIYNLYNNGIDNTEGWAGVTGGITLMGVSFGYLKNINEHNSTLNEQLI